MSELQLNEADKLEYERVLNEWIEEVKKIPPYEERHPNRQKNVLKLDYGSNGPYTELEKIYKPQLEAIKARGGKK